MNLHPFRILFIIAAIWNLIGAIFGFFDTAYIYEATFDRPLTDPLMFAIYQGSWGTTLTYFVGYLIVAYNPWKHYGIAVIGGLGKLGYIATLLRLYFAGIANSSAIVIIVGDALFILAFAYYLHKLYESHDRQKV